MRHTRWWSTAALALGALVFLFPFYYMVIGSLQETLDTSSREPSPPVASR